MQSAPKRLSEPGPPPPAELSVIIVTVDGGDAIAKVLRHLDAQTGRDCMEVIVVGPPQARFDILPTMPGLRARVVQLPALTSMARARAAAVREASGPVIAFLEDHCFPATDWAERLLAAHQEDYAGVGPVICNANPRTLTSWANLLIDYGPWVFVAERTEMDFLPGHNGSYKREALLAYGDRLEAMLDAECVLHWDLRRQGRRLLLEPAIKVQHLNYSLFANSVRLRWCCGRAFAGARAQGWSPLRRVAFAFAAPLIPWVRARRIVRRLRQAGKPAPSATTLLPVLLLLLTVDALGEAAGYLCGFGHVRQVLAALELHRERHLLPVERDAVFV